MEITGKIIAVLDERSGTSARTGTEWRVGSFVIETSEQYPKKMCFEVFGSDRLQAFNIKLGETLTVKFDIDAHEYNGRWYNTIRVYQVDRTVEATPSPNASHSAAQFAPQPAPAPAAPDDNDDSELPF